MEKAGRRTFSVPWYITLLAIFWAASATIYTVYSNSQNFHVKTPFVAEFFATESDLKMEGITLTFDVSTNRYSNATLDVRNDDYSTSHAGTVYVYLYDSVNTEIARGSVSTGTISPGVRVGNIIVPLYWTGAYTARDFVRGKVTITQAS